MHVAWFDCSVIIVVAVFFPSVFICVSTVVGHLSRQQNCNTRNLNVAMKEEQWEKYESKFAIAKCTTTTTTTTTIKLNGLQSTQTNKWHRKNKLTEKYRTSDSNDEQSKKKKNSVFIFPSQQKKKSLRFFSLAQFCCCHRQVTWLLTLWKYYYFFFFLFFVRFRLLRFCSFVVLCQRIAIDHICPVFLFMSAFNFFLFESSKYLFNPFWLRVCVTTTTTDRQKSEKKNLFFLSFHSLWLAFFASLESSRCARIRIHTHATMRWRSTKYEKIEIVFVCVIVTKKQTESARIMLSVSFRFPTSIEFSILLWPPICFTQVWVWRIFGRC